MMYDAAALIVPIVQVNSSKSIINSCPVMRMQQVGNSLLHWWTGLLGSDRSQR